MHIFLGYKFLEFLALITPYPICYFVAFILAKAAIMGNINTEVIKTNVSNVLGLDKNDREVRKVVTKIYINWLYNIVDFLKHPLISKEKLKERVELIGRENLEKALKKGKGVVIFTAHIGNFEWGACRIAIEGFNTFGTGLSRPHKRTNNFFESRRLSKGLKTIHVNNLLHIFKLLKNNEVIAIPTDWDSLGTAKKYVFFGKNAYIPSGPVEIAMKSGAPLLPSFIHRKGKYTHYQVIGKQLDLDVDSSLNKKELIEINTKKMTAILEQYIREYLDQWEMFHNIWA